MGGRSEAGTTGVDAEVRMEIFTNLVTNLRFILLQRDFEHSVATSDLQTVVAERFHELLARK